MRVMGIVLSGGAREKRGRAGSAHQSKARSLGRWSGNGVGSCGLLWGLPVCSICPSLWGSEDKHFSPPVHTREGSGAGMPAFKPSSCSRSAKPPPIAT